MNSDSKIEANKMIRSFAYDVHHFRNVEFSFTSSKGDLLLCPQLEEFRQGGYVIRRQKWFNMDCYTYLMKKMIDTRKKVSI